MTQVLTFFLQGMGEWVIHWVSNGVSVKAEVHLPFLDVILNGNGYAELKFGEGCVTETKKFSDLIKMFELPCGIIFSLEQSPHKIAAMEQRKIFA